MKMRVNLTKKTSRRLPCIFVLCILLCPFFVASCDMGAGSTTADSTRLKEGDTVPLQDGLLVANSLIKDGEFMQASTVLQYLRDEYPDEHGIVELLDLVNPKLELLWESTLKESSLDEAPLTADKLLWADKTAWMLIEKQWMNLPRLSAEAIKLNTEVISEQLEQLLQRVPNFWEGRFLQAILAITLNEDAQGREALARIKRWNALPELKPAYLDTYKARGWLDE